MGDGDGVIKPTTLPKILQICSMLLNAEIMQNGYYDMSDALFNVDLDIKFFDKN